MVTVEDEVLFQITKEHLETGLRGVPVGYCTTSFVDPRKGLFYIDKPVSAVASWTPVQVLYLLYFGKEGSLEDVTVFAQKMKQRSCCSSEVISSIQALPRVGHPMKLFAAAILILGMFESTGDYEEDCFNLLAKLPHLVAIVINHHAGWGSTPLPQPDLGYIENLVQMLQVPCVNKAELARLFNLFYVLHIDHGGGNLSTFVGKAVASGLEDLYGAIASSLCALEGSRHGRANQEGLAFVMRILDEVGDQASEADVEKSLRNSLAQGERICGFGHAVLRVEDPRASVQYAFAKRYYSQVPIVKIALLLRSVGPKVLKENAKISDPYPNVDAVSGPLLTAAGFCYPEYYTVLFGLARSAGIAIQIVYERCSARGGKGVPIIRPKYLFKNRKKNA